MCTYSTRQDQVGREAHCPRWVHASFPSVHSRFAPRRPHRRDHHRPPSTREGKPNCERWRLAAAGFWLATTTQPHAGLVERRCCARLAEAAQRLCVWRQGPEVITGGGGRGRWWGNQCPRIDVVFARRRLKRQVARKGATGVPHGVLPQTAAPGASAGGLNSTYRPVVFLPSSG